LGTKLFLIIFCVLVLLEDRSWQSKNLNVQNHT
jgi:hypothetical protein